MRRKPDYEKIAALESEVFPELVAKPEPEWFFRVHFWPSWAHKDFDTPDEAKAFMAEIVGAPDDYWVQVDEWHTLRASAIVGVAITRYMRGPA